MKPHRPLYPARLPAARRGFSLVELMIVIAIIAIMAAVMLPSFRRARAQGLLNACEQNLKAIATAIEMYAADNGGLPPLHPSRGSVERTGRMNETHLTSLLDPYLRSGATCPSTNLHYMYMAVNSVTTGSWTMVYHEVPSQHREMGLTTLFPVHTMGHPDLPNGINRGWLP